jgi:hypothetical protein
MTGNELKKVFDTWQITAGQGAKILCLHTGTLSEYLSDVTRIPCSVRFHIEALNHLDDTTRATLFKRRLARRAHSN